MFPAPQIRIRATATVTSWIRLGKSCFSDIHILGRNRITGVSIKRMAIYPILIKKAGQNKFVNGQLKAIRMTTPRNQGLKKTAKKYDRWASGLLKNSSVKTVLRNWKYQNRLVITSKIRTSSANIPLETMEFIIHI